MGGKTGDRRGPVVKAMVPKSFSQGRLMANTSATPTRELPGSMSEPGIHGYSDKTRGRGRGRVSSDEKEIRHRRSQLKTPQPVTSGYAGGQHSNGFEERGGSSRGGVGIVQRIRGACENDGGQFSSSSSLGDGEPPRLAPVKPKGKSRRYIHVYD